MSIKSFFSKFGHFFVSIWQVFSKGEVKAIREKVKDFTEIAYPVIKMINGIIPGEVDDQLVQAALNIGKSVDGISRTVEEIVTNTDDLIRHGGKQRLAVETIKLRLIELVQKEGKVKFDNFVFETVEDVLNLDPGFLRAAVEDTYLLFKQKELKDKNK